MGEACPEMEPGTKQTALARSEKRGEINKKVPHLLL